jgi:hypothetical protein
MRLRRIGSGMIGWLTHLGWVSALFTGPPPQVWLVKDPQPPPADPPPRPVLFPEVVSGAPMTPAERELWADLLGR